MKRSTMQLVVAALDGPCHALAVALLREECNGAIEPQLPLVPSRAMTAAERQAKRRRDIASRNVTADVTPIRDMSRDVSRDSRALSLSDSSEVLENSERESSSLVTRESVTPVTAVTSRTVTASRHGERYIAITDAPDDEMKAIADMIGVQEPGLAWAKFTGHYAGKWVHVAGAWQKWCATEAKHERVERERERDRAKNSASPLTAEGLDPQSYEACQLRKKRRKAEEDAETAARLAEFAAQQKASAQ